MNTKTYNITRIQNYNISVIQFKKRNVTEIINFIQSFNQDLKYLFNYSFGFAVCPETGSYLYDVLNITEMGNNDLNIRLESNYFLILKHINNKILELESVSKYELKIKYPEVLEG
jgi:hypothetical protein